MKLLKKVSLCCITILMLCMVLSDTIFFAKRIYEIPNRRISLLSDSLAQLASSKYSVFSSIEYINNNVAKDAIVLTFLQNQFERYGERAYIRNLDSRLQPFYLKENKNDALAFLKELGVEYIHTPGYPTPTLQNTHFQEILADPRYAELMADHAGSRVYKLIPENEEINSIDITDEFESITPVDTDKKSSFSKKLTTRVIGLGEESGKIIHTRGMVLGEGNLYIILEEYSTTKSTPSSRVVFQSNLYGEEQPFAFQVQTNPEADKFRFIYQFHSYQEIGVQLFTVRLFPAKYDSYTYELNKKCIVKQCVCTLNSNDSCDDIASGWGGKVRMILKAPISTTRKIYKCYSNITSQVDV